MILKVKIIAHVFQEKDEFFSTSPNDIHASQGPLYFQTLITRLLSSQRFADNQLKLFSIIVLDHLINAK